MKENTIILYVKYGDETRWPCI